MSTHYSRRSDPPLYVASVRELLDYVEERIVMSYQVDKDLRTRLRKSREDVADVREAIEKALAKTEEAFRSPEVRRLFAEYVALRSRDRA